jgi:hypothetical protein
VPEPEQHVSAQISLLPASCKASVSAPVNHHMGSSGINTSLMHCKQIYKPCEQSLLAHLSSPLTSSMFLPHSPLLPESKHNLISSQKNIT